jgi:hypothetical protein
MSKNISKRFRHCKDKGSIFLFKNSYNTKEFGNRKKQETKWNGEDERKQPSL